MPARALLLVAARYPFDVGDRGGLLIAASSRAARREGSSIGRVSRVSLASTLDDGRRRGRRLLAGSQARLLLADRDNGKEQRK